MYPPLTVKPLSDRGDRPLRPDPRWFSKPMVNGRRLSPGRWRGLPSPHRTLRTPRNMALSLSRLFALIAQRTAVDDEEESARAIP